MAEMTTKKYTFEASESSKYEPTNNERFSNYFSKNHACLKMQLF